MEGPNYSTDKDIKNDIKGDSTNTAMVELITLRARTGPAQREIARSLEETGHYQETAMYDNE